MTSAPRLSRVNLATAIAAGLLCAPAAIAAQFDYFLKLPPIEGESDDKHKDQIEILSWSWGASQSGTASHGGGMGAGKVNVHDISATQPSAGKVSKVDAFTIKQGTAAAAAANDRLRNAGPRDGQAAAAAGEAEITLKGSAAAGGTEDINIGVGELAGKRTPPTVTLKRGMASDAAAAGGVSVAAGDVDGDGRADLASPRDSASGLPTGKRQHKPMTMTMGSLSVDVPAGMCRAGARYPSAEFGTPQGVYTLESVVVTGCVAAPAAAGSRPSETLSLNYEKIR